MYIGKIGNLFLYRQVWFVVLEVIVIQENVGLNLGLSICWWIVAPNLIHQIVILQLIQYYLPIVVLPGIDVEKVKEIVIAMMIVRYLNTSSQFVQGFSWWMLQNLPCHSQIEYKHAIFLSNMQILRQFLKHNPWNCGGAEWYTYYILKF